MSKPLSLESATLRFAGIMVLVSVALTAFVHPLFIWFTVFVGANMVQSTYTGFCPATIVFKKLGIKPACEITTTE